MSWLLFKSNLDYRWPSGAVTEFNAGGKYQVKKEVEEAALAAKVAEKTTKPTDDDPAYTAPPARHRGHEMTFVERHEPLKSARVGHEYERTGNPLDLPDPADPNAIRAEPLEERDGGEASDAVTEADRG